MHFPPCKYTVLMQPKRGPGRFVFINLQKRLLSSIEAFCRTLNVHANKLKDRFGQNLLRDDFQPPAEPSADESLNSAQSGEVLPLPQECLTARDEQEDEHDRDVDTQSAASSGKLAVPSAEARKLLAEMLLLAERHRHSPDAKVYALVDWIRENQCKGVGFSDSKLSKADKKWADHRLIVFTEYADTKRYLMAQLQRAFERTGDAERILDFHGAMGDTKRQYVQDAFNGDLEEFPARVLLATDAAREGLNLQNHSYNLFHFDIPWNPSRLEQRNGRIDRTLQPSPEVWCHYFVYPDRVEDSVLDKVMDKVSLIQRELGTLGDVVMQKLGSALAEGINSKAEEQVGQVTVEDLQQKLAAEQELESQRRTIEQLKIDTDEAGALRNKSAKIMQFKESLLLDAVNVGLELVGKQGLQPLRADNEKISGYELPELPPSWAGTLDSLRAPQKKGELDWEWRKRPLQPVVFKPLERVGEDRVHLHLEHPFVQRIMSRFLSQGFGANDLSRVSIVPNGNDGLVRVIAFGRISLFGEGATRLHDRIVSVAAQWLESKGEGHLRPFADPADRRAVETFEDLLAEAPEHAEIPDAVKKRVLKSAAQDFAALWPAVKDEAEEKAHQAKGLLAARGENEAKALRKIIGEQRVRIEERLNKIKEGEKQGTLVFEAAAQKAQLSADVREMEKRLAASAAEMRREPEELQAVYKVALTRLERVGLVYLWPTTRL